MRVGYAGVLPIRPVKRDNKDKPQLIEPRCWGYAPPFKAAGLYARFGKKLNYPFKPIFVPEIEEKQKLLSQYKMYK